MENVFLNPQYFITECCPHCNIETIIYWDVSTDGYEIYCPNCGKKFMLCNQCEDVHYCDCNEESGCKRKAPFLEEEADIFTELLSVEEGLAERLNKLKGRFEDARNLILQGFEKAIKILNVAQR